MPAGFRLLTANLLHTRSDIDAFQALVDRTDPDVVVTQELAPHAAAMLSSRFPNHRFFPAVDFTGRGIGTRLEAELGDIDMPRRKGTWARVDVEGEAVWIAGVHLLNPINFPWWRAARARRHQLDALFAWMSHVSGPLVVAGDFNASPVWPAYKHMEEHLTDVVSQLAARRGDTPERTWGWRPGWPRLLRIDHVFARGFEARDVFVEPILGSDHFAVVVDLIVAGEGDRSASVEATDRAS